MPGMAEAAEQSRPSGWILAWLPHSFKIQLRVQAKIKAAQPEKIMRTFIDLFAGIGGFRTALERKGLKCVFSSEIDRHARDVYKKNFGEEPAGDITEISEENIPPHDILCAGFPCQSFSISGRQEGLEDNRGRLFYEIVRIAEYHKPRILLLENVRNILTVDKGRVIKIIKKRLNKAGYRVFPKTLNASRFGVPQKRERVYFVCLRKDLAAGYEAPKPTDKPVYLRDILEKSPSASLFVEKRNDISRIDKKKAAQKDLKPVRIGFLNKGGQGERIYSINGHAITLSANGGGVGARAGLYWTPGKNGAGKPSVRKLSMNERKKLMGFSEAHYVSPGMQGHKQLGNAVIPSMIEAVYDSIRIT